MKQDLDIWRDVVLPIAASMGAFCGLNFIWAVFGLYRFIPPALSVYMVGSLVALAFLARAIQQGTLTAEEVGLGASGWRPLRRLYALLLTVSLVAYLYLTPDPHLKTPLQFADYCFWLFFLLAASLAELLIFVCVGYCLPEKWLRTRGWPTWQAIVLAGVFSGCTFGWHHYTGEPQHFQWSWVTIPVMWINLLYFIPARNFQLTLFLHNAVAAVGFTQSQHAHDPPRPFESPSDYNDPFYITAFITAFALPYVLLHVLEWWASARRTNEALLPEVTEPIKPLSVETT
jgi:hypothetical protein